MTESIRSAATPDNGPDPTARIALGELNAASPEAFTARLGGIFEHGRWIADAAASRRPFASREELHAAMSAVVRDAPVERQVEFILGHPDLAGPRLKVSGVSEESAADQRSIGWHLIDAGTADRLVRVNEEYRERFGFSCIVCVRLRPDPDDVIAEVVRRKESTREAQIAENLDEIDKISWLRVQDLVASGSVTTHVLDTVRGTPGAGIRVDVSRREDDAWVHLKTLTTNADGRTDAPILSEAEFIPGRYEVRFQVGDYFERTGVAVATSPYLDEVPVEANLADPDAHYHVPLIVAPWGYSTYRGS